MSPKRAKSKGQNWIRTGGAVGDESMSKLDEFYKSGCGVSEDVESVGADPNRKFLSRKANKNRVD